MQTKYEKFGKLVLYLIIYYNYEYIVHMRGIKCTNLKQSRQPKKIFS